MSSCVEYSTAGSDAKTAACTVGIDRYWWVSHTSLIEPSLVSVCVCCCQEIVVDLIPFRSLKILKFEKSGCDSFQGQVWLSKA